MALIVMPALPKIASVRVIPPVPPTQVTRSWVTGAQKVVVLAQNTRMELEVTVNPTFDRAISKPWRSFFAQLEGQANVFDIGMGPQTHTFAEMRANGLHAQGATSIAVDGMAASKNYLADGDYVTIPLSDGNRQTVICIGGLVSSATGTGTLTFKPALRRSVSDNTLLNSKTPYARVALVSDKPEWIEGKNGEFSLPPFAVEEVY